MTYLCFVGEHEGRLVTVKEGIKKYDKDQGGKEGDVEERCEIEETKSIRVAIDVNHSSAGGHQTMYGQEEPAVLIKWWLVWHTKSVAYFGLLLAFALVSALFSDLLVVPALIVLLGGTIPTKA